MGFAKAGEVYTNCTIKGALLVLLSQYYIFDLDYSKPYSMPMALLQVFVIDEPYKRETSIGYKVLVKKLRLAFEQKLVEESSETPLP